MEDVKITIDNQPNPDEDAVFRGLNDYNAKQTGDSSYTRLTVLMRDGRDKVLGGLVGGIHWGWLHVDVLWIDESVRAQGYGARLLALAEQKAMESDCRAVYLDTFSFQAPEFYQRHGYEIFGTLDKFPAGHTRYFLRKTL